MAYKGPDISEHNGKIDFTKIKGNYDFVILRCGYGSDYPFQDDGEFLNNAQSCERLGIPYGVYLYSYAGSTAAAISEAEHVLRLIKGRKVSCGIWYDVEDAQLPKSDSLLTDICIAFLEYLENRGYYAGIYSNLSWLETRLSSSRLDPYDKWVAQWNDTCDYSKPYGIWQYTSSAVIPGLSGRFDMNNFYKNYPAITGGGGDRPDTAKKFIVTPKIGLNVRKAPGTDSDILRALPYGSIVTVISSENGWGLLEGGGYIAMNYTEELGIGRKVTVTPDIGLNIRKGPGTGYDIIRAVPKGTVLNIIHEENGWGLVDSGGFVSMEYTR